MGNSGTSSDWSQGFSDGISCRPRRIKSRKPLHSGKGGQKVAEVDKTRKQLIYEAGYFEGMASRRVNARL